MNLRTDTVNDRNSFAVYKLKALINHCSGKEDAANNYARGHYTIGQINLKFFLSKLTRIGFMVSIRLLCGYIPTFEN